MVNPSQKKKGAWHPIIWAQVQNINYYDKQSDTFLAMCYACYTALQKKNGIREWGLH